MRPCVAAVRPHGRVTVQTYRRTVWCRRVVPPCPVRRAVLPCRRRAQCCAAAPPCRAAVVPPCGVRPFGGAVPACRHADVRCGHAAVRSSLRAALRLCCCAAALCSNACRAAKTETRHSLQRRPGDPRGSSAAGALPAVIAAGAAPPPGLARWFSRIAAPRPRPALRRSRGVPRRPPERCLGHYSVWPPEARLRPQFSVRNVLPQKI